MYPLEILDVSWVRRLMGWASGALGLSLADCLHGGLSDDQHGSLQQRLNNHLSNHSFSSWAYS